MTNDTIRNVTGATTTRRASLRDVAAGELERVSGGSGGGIAGSVVGGAIGIIIGVSRVQQGSQQFKPFNAPTGCDGNDWGGGANGDYAGLCS